MKQNPKIVSGYSDITILLNVLFEYADLIGFQSFLLLDFNPQTPTYNFDQFFCGNIDCHCALANYQPTWSST
ncbi:LD-carboxypeptidase [Sporosarcina obsidiansis]|uniref:LD-carboxypeptidase n=1 Tax=Sporosarcina obsidiansis TaxID=2660748 RepID=UPI0038B43588